MGLEALVELLGGGDLDPPLEPPLAIFDLMNVTKNYYNA